MSAQDLFFIVDVESLGLYGDPFAIAYGVYKMDLTHLGLPVALEEGVICINRDNVHLKGSKDDIEWVSKNIPLIEINSPSKYQMLNSFWKKWQEVKVKYPQIVMAAECLYPVEANMLIECVRLFEKERKFAAPYPLFEISTAMQLAGMDIHEKYARLESELPEHHPLADIRQSARLLNISLGKLAKND